MSKIQAGIIGATGYTGSELVRILLNHPQVNIALVTSESRPDTPFSEIHPFFTGLTDLETQKAEAVNDTDLDIVFLALPHGVSMDFVKKYHKEAFRIVDLSGDFRLHNTKVYENWYKKKHNFAAGFDIAEYGLPEWHGEAIKKAKLAANPGCFPTSAVLAAAPLVKSGTVYSDNIIIDSKTGITGAGVKPKKVNHYSNVNDNFKAYGLLKHRHTIEIQEQITGIAHTESRVLFSPHLLPVDRGILSTVYLKPKNSFDAGKLHEIFEEAYQNAPFVRLRKEPPAIKEVRGTNFCDIYPVYDERTDTLIVLSVIDNLVKGAAGQAVQNMNLMFDFPETEGLSQIPLHP